MIKKLLLPAYTCSALLVVSACGDSSSQSANERDIRLMQTNETDTTNDQATGQESLDPQLAEFSGVNQTETMAIEEDIANVLAENSPLSQFTQNGHYTVTIHALKDDPDVQSVNHLYCSRKSEHFSQCLVFDGNNPSANLNGVEYIISAEAYELLPAEEKQHWHPHNFSILSGQLVAPGMSEEQQQELLQSLMNSYGKNWQTWLSRPYEQEAQPIPLGEAKLSWSINAEGQVREGLIEARDQSLNVNSQELREQRQNLVELAEPQCGVDLLEAEFENIEYIPGVEARDINECFQAEVLPSEEGTEESQSVAVEKPDTQQETDDTDVQPISPSEEPAPQTDDDSAEEPSDEPTQQQQTSEESKQPVTQESQQQVTQESEKPTAQQSQQSTQESQQQSAQQSQQSAQQAQQSTQESQQQSAQQSQQSTQESQQQSAQQSQQSTQESQQQSAQQSQQSTQESQQQSAQQSQQSTQESQQQSAKEPAQEPDQAPADEQPADEPSDEQPADEPSDEQPADEPAAEEPTDEEPSDEQSPGEKPAQPAQ